MRLVHLSDLHFGAFPRNPLDLFSKRIIGTFNWLFKRRTLFSTDLLEPLPDLFRSLHVDHILVTGDLTTTSLARELAQAKAFLNRLPAPTWVLPGNHDQYTRRDHRRKTFYRTFSNPPSSSSLAHDQFELHTLSPDWHLLLLDTAPATSFGFSGGHFPETLEKRLDTLFSSLSGSILVANHFPFAQTPNPALRLIRGEALARLLERHTPRVRLYLHGHTHRHIIGDLQPSGLPVTSDSGSATYQERPSWNLLDLSDQGCTFTPYRFNKEGWRADPSQSIAWKVPS